MWKESGEEFASASEPSKYPQAFYASDVPQETFKDEAAC